MELLIFKPHSVVDLITNSSSELFVFDEDVVSTARIYEIVALLRRAFADTRPMPEFEAMFGEPYVVTKSYRDVLEECPVKLPPIPPELVPEPYSPLGGYTSAQRDKLYQWKKESGYWEAQYAIYDWISNNYPEFDDVAGYEDYYSSIYDIEEGDIMLPSASDNTVPLPIMEALGYIAKERIHLG